MRRSIEVQGREGLTTRSYLDPSVTCFQVKFERLSVMIPAAMRCKKGFQSFRRLPVGGK